MDSQFIVTAYFIYLLIALLFTWHVANTLFRNGLVFMPDVFGREKIAVTTNTLFRIGFYLLNIVFALFILKIVYIPSGTPATIEALSFKIGGVSIYLGVLQFFNMYLFFRGKRVAEQKHNVHLLLQKRSGLGGAGQGQ